MAYLSESEWLLWGGLATMVMAAVLGLIAAILFFLLWRKIKRTLDREYGKPYK